MESSVRSRKEKILFNITLLLIAVGCSWIFAGRIDGVREGTVIVAVLTGPVVRMIRPHLKFIDRWEEAPTVKGDKGKNDMPTQESADQHPVITIGRGKTWGDPDNYDAVFYTSRLSSEAIVKAAGLYQQV